MRTNFKSLVKRIPSSVRITPDITYEVAWVDSFKNENTLGETRLDTKQILIKKGLSPLETVSTYLHEILHAVSEETSANLTENQVLALEKFVCYGLKKGNIFK